LPKVKLHRCPLTFIHTNGHGCWRVQKALDEQGIEYELVKTPLFPHSRRKDVIRISGQPIVPVIEFEDGSAYRAESEEMAETIEAGRLFEQARPTG
jgi:glutathione S-transferase